MIIDHIIIQLGLKRCTDKYGMYVLSLSDNDITMICLYVDDLLITGNNKDAIKNLKFIMHYEFEMTGLGKLSYFLGTKFITIKLGIVMHQQKYICELLDRLDMTNCNIIINQLETNAKVDECIIKDKVEVTMFKHMAGSQRYLCNSKPDICFAVSIINGKHE